MSIHIQDPPSPERVELEIRRLRAILPAIPPHGVTGSDNIAAVNAQLAVLTGKLTKSADVCLAFENAEEEIRFQALEARGWLAGEDWYEPPANGWLQLLGSEAPSLQVDSDGDLSDSQIEDLTHLINPATAHGVIPAFLLPILGAQTEAITGMTDVWLLITATSAITTAVITGALVLAWKRGYRRCAQDIEQRNWRSVRAQLQSWDG